MSCTTFHQCNSRDDDSSHLILFTLSSREATIFSATARVNSNAYERMFALLTMYVK